MRPLLQIYRPQVNQSTEITISLERMADFFMNNVRQNRRFPFAHQNSSASLIGICNHLDNLSSQNHSAVFANSPPLANRLTSSLHGKRVLRASALIPKLPSGRVSERSSEVRPIEKRVEPVKGPRFPIMRCERALRVTIASLDRATDCLLICAQRAAPAIASSDFY
jgi:hypothetical protein